MNKKLFALNAILLTTVLVSCGNTKNPTSNSIDSLTSNDINTSNTNKVEVIKKEKPTIFLAGDSTVKTYSSSQFIGGWGQFLDLFVNEDITIKNCANGGRSSRSFINEGRLYKNEGSTYNFSENNGASIEEEIENGDFLMIQFGHNDDDTKSNYATLYDRMVPLGEKDENGIYPTTPATKVDSTHLPEEYLNSASESEKAKALSEIAKYGTSYYAYDSGGTYKWYLKQYIDLARSKGAIPVLVTPVPRIKFSGGEIIGGPGLHGDNFAYVEAVRQLASEEDCLLVDLFKDVKEILEVATSEYANYLMALKPNDLQGTWPSDYDKTYNNASLGYTGIEATHYNKYGAFISAAKVAEAFINDETKHNNENEYFYFSEKVLKNPKSYIDPSNLLSKTKVAEIEALFKKVNVTNPNRTYKDRQEVVDLIDAYLVGEVTQDNYLEFKDKCNEIEANYNDLNVDDRVNVTNYSKVIEYKAKVEELIEANRPKPTSTIVYSFDDASLGTISETQEYNGVTIVASQDKNISYKASAVTFNHNGASYSYSGGLSMGGTAKFGESRYIEFSVSSKCSITVAAKSSSASADRVLNLANEQNQNVATLDAKASLSLSSYEADKEGTFKVGSAGSGVYIYAIIIDYYA